MMFFFHFWECFNDTMNSASLDRRNRMFKKDAHVLIINGRAALVNTDAALNRWNAI